MKVKGKKGERSDKGDESREEGKEGGQGARRTLRRSRTLVSALAWASAATFFFSSSRSRRTALSRSPLIMSLVLAPTKP